MGEGFRRQGYDEVEVFGWIVVGIERFAWGGWIEGASSQCEEDGKVLGSVEPALGQESQNTRGVERISKFQRVWRVDVYQMLAWRVGHFEVEGGLEELSSFGDRIVIGAVFISAGEDIVRFSGGDLVEEVVPSCDELEEADFFDAKGDVGGECGLALVEKGLKGAVGMVRCCARMSGISETLEHVLPF
jgi:hypothetical protein